MENIASSGASSRSMARVVVKRRVWSPREEAVLILALKEIIHEGWKCENGFRTGYLSQLEKTIRRHFPGTDLKAEPHIGNKIHVWKKNHGSIQTMLSRSGFEWSDKDHVVVFHDDSIWDEYVKTDNHAKGMKNKSYPLYKDWCEIFGKDRATGEHAEDLQAADDYQLPVDDEHVAPDEANDAEMGENDITSAMDESTKPNLKTTNKRKRVADDAVGEKMLHLCNARVCLYLQIMH